jgi:hypothetical protein
VRCVADGSPAVAAAVWFFVWRGCTNILARDGSVATSPGIESDFRLTVAQTFAVYKTPKRGGTAPVKKADIQCSGH